ncbi:hypothetical protein MLD38_035479 [Melastoma candidum]|uniref:Uncharacterized protein n=1 Tax=Melastoma candidum TaxID=119954 RepID=A0ACB9LIH0_9MYRT|nr:hypothetical protein MLD38_035479 [Melastoma candidum]
MPVVGQVARGNLLKSFKSCIGPNERVKQIYIPVCVSESHWTLQVVNFSTGVVLLLDTANKGSSNIHGRMDLHMRVLTLLRIIMEENTKHSVAGIVPDFTSWPVRCPASVPQQFHLGNEADCGIYVMKFMSMGDPTDGLADVRVSPLDRIRLTVSLMKWPGNTLKKSLLGKVKGDALKRAHSATTTRDVKRLVR